jgi:hypothetical protein
MFFLGSCVFAAGQSFTKSVSFWSGLSGSTILSET